MKYLYTRKKNTQVSKYWKSVPSFRYKHCRLSGHDTSLHNNSDPDNELGRNRREEWKDRGKQERHLYIEITGIVK